MSDAQQLEVILERDKLKAGLLELAIIAKRIDDSDCGKMTEAYPGKPYHERQELLRMDNRSLVSKVLVMLNAVYPEKS